MTWKSWLFFTSFFAHIEPSATVWRSACGDFGRCLGYSVRVHFRYSVFSAHKAIILNVGTHYARRGAVPECNILSCQNVQYGTVPGLISNLILVFIGLKIKYKIDQLCNYIILLTNHPLLFTVSTDMKNTFIQTSCDLFDLSHDSTWLAWAIAMTWPDLLDFDHSNLGLARGLKVKTWDLLMTCT